MRKELSFKDFIIVLLRELKKIVLYTLIFAFVFAIYGGLNSYFVQSSVTIVDEQSHKEQITFAEQNLAYLTGYKESCESLLNDSIYLSLDAGNVAVYEMYLSIYDEHQLGQSSIATIPSADSTAPSSEPSITTINIVKDYYLANARSQSILSDLAETIGKDVSIWDYERFVKIEEESSNIVKITIYYHDLSTAKQLAESISTSLNDKATMLYGPHKMEVVSTLGYYSVFGEIKDERLLMRETIDELETQIETEEKNLDTLQKIPQSAQAISKKVIAKQALKWLLIGAVIGFVIIYIISLIRQQNKGKIEDTYDVKTRYNIPILGVLQEGTEKKHLFAKWIAKLQGETILQDSATQIDMLQEVYEVLSEDKKILLTGSLDEKDICAVANKISSSADIMCGGNLLQYPKTVKKVSLVDSVILVERLGKSEINEMNEIIMTLESFDKEISGIILI